MDSLQLLETKGASAIASPHAIYTERLQQNRGEWATRRQWDRFFGYSKLALGALGVFFLVRFVHELHGFSFLSVTLVVFAILSVLHELVLATIKRLDALIAFYERGLARLEDRWAGTGESGDRFTNEAHPYARDLNLFGHGSVFELLCTSRTRAGQNKLAGWLLEPAPPEEIRTRQHAVKELKERSKFRESLFTAGATLRIGLRPEALAAWAVKPFSVQSPAVAISAIALATLWLACLALAGKEIYWPVLLVSFINMIVNGNFKKRLKDVIWQTEAAAEDLDLLAAVLRVIEEEPFGAGRLADLQSSLRVGRTTASVAIRRLDRITRFLEHRRNLAIRSIDSFFFYTVLCALKAESWRRKYGPAIRAWLDALGEIESLAALSCYAFEHPNDAWPEFCTGEPLFEAEQLAHPLVPETRAVRNDVKLGYGLQLMVLSGPNMSGKSTLVRAIGLNAVLAQCGAPVRATRLKMSPLAVGASICVLDSLQGGVSRFYAEIKRLKLISDATHGPIPVLFLLDELLSGTNSHDRLQGSELLVRALVQQGAIGLITTHDLALARIPDSMKGRARNYHFDDRLENGKLIFEFKLKEGVAQTSNALRLMESIGLLNQPAPKRS